MYVAAVVPTIDEAETIGDLVRALDKFCDVVYVPDDSKDSRTIAAAHEAGAWSHHGLGSLASAYQIGENGIKSEEFRLWYIAASPGERQYRRPERSWYVLHIDAGGSHDPQDAYEMLDLAAEGFDVVIGSRFMDPGSYIGNRRRKWASRFAAGAMNLISFQDISDWTSGYRVYSPKARAVLAEHTFTTSGHAWQIEALWVCIQHGCRIVEHPIVYRAGVSHLSRKRVVEAVRLWWRLVWA